MPDADALITTETDMARQTAAPQQKTQTRDLTAKRVTITGAPSPRVKKLVQNFERRTKGHKTAKKLEILLNTITMDLLNWGDQSMSMSDLLYQIVYAWQMAQQLDARRGYLQPTSGGKAV